MIKKGGEGMDHNAMVEEIMRRVAAKLSAAEECCAAEAAAPCEEGKPGLLVLTQDHGTDCHATLDSEALKAHYATDCALMHHYEVDLDAYEVIVLFDLSCDAMAALASGACDTAYSRLASKAILSGKKVYVPTEEVELYRYKESAPAAYYSMMQQKLDLLVASGVVICAEAGLEQAILGGAAAPAPQPAAAPVVAPLAASSTLAPMPHQGEEKEVRIDKRVLTEKDLIEANMDGVTRVHIGEKTIVTALAKDAAKDRGMTLIRDED